MDQTKLQEHQNAIKILEKSWLLFQQKGFKGVSMDEVCQVCGITKPTLYYYFKDKETLFVEVLTHWLHSFHASIHEEGSFRERLDAVAGIILQTFTTDYSTLERDREHIHKEENRQILGRAFREEMYMPLMELMQAGKVSGALKNEDSHTLVLIFLGMVNSFIGTTGGEEETSNKLARRITGIFLEGAGR